MKVLVFIVFLLVVLWFVKNVQEGATNPPPTPQQVYDVLKELPPTNKIKTTMDDIETKILQNVNKIGSLDKNKADYDTKLAELKNESTKKGTQYDILNTLSTENKRKTAAVYMQELKASNPTLT